MKNSWKFYLNKFWGTFDFIFQNNHDSYRDCRGRNMPPFCSYEKLKTNFVCNHFGEMGPWCLITYENNELRTAKSKHGILSK